MIYKLSEILTSYVEKNIEQKYQPVAVGKYGIRKREDIYKKELAKDYSKNKVIRKDTLTIGMGSTQIDIGILVENEVYSVSPAYHTYKINTSIVYSEFLEWILKEMNPELSKLYMISSARQGKSVDFERMMNHKINIPTLDKQLIIIKKLKHIDNLISNMKTNYSKYDEIVKSQFIEMFGDPINNEKKWNQEQLANVCKVINGRAYKDSELLDSGKYRVLRVGNFFTNNSWYYSDLELPEDKYCEYGDLLFAWSASFGPRIWRGEKVIYHYHIWKLSNYEEKLNKVFFMEHLNYQVEELRNNTHGSTMQHFTKADMEKQMLVIPPIELQNKFADFVQQIDKSKYFGGD